MNDSLEKLSKYFKEFPGIGERQAKRFVYFLLHKDNNYVKDLAEEILSVKNSIKQCTSCFVFFPNDNRSALCPICSNNKTDHSLLLIVEKDADYESIVKSKTYNGMYFILGGLAPIVTKETPKFIKIKELFTKVQEMASSEELKEVIIALSLNPQGENTDRYLREVLSPLQKRYNFKIVSFGRGLSTGTELEYSDSETIKNALLNRQ